VSKLVRKDGVPKWLAAWDAYRNQTEEDNRRRRHGGEGGSRPTCELQFVQGRDAVYS
jgi:hypothetical protein